MERPGPPLRIGMIAPPWFEIPPTKYGGIEAMCHWLVRGLRARGHHVVLVAAGRDRMSGSFVQTYASPPRARLGQALPELVHAAEASRALDALGLDLIHDHSAAGPLMAGSRRSPTLVTAHGPVTGELGRFYRALGDRIWLVAISESQRRAVEDLRWVRTVHNGIRVEDYPYVASKDPFLLFMGRMSPEKGAHLAIQAARAAHRRLVLAGKCIEPAERAYFESEIRPHLSADVRYVGEVGGFAKKRLLSRARCLLFPIRWEEPFGMVMIEAMACGTPVVALAGGSVEEIVREGTTGFVRSEVEDLPEAIEAAGGLLPQDSRDHVSGSFGAEAMVAGYEAAYREVIRQASAADRRGEHGVLLSDLRPKDRVPTS
jgi:glycosyltransferase involved in cell wall biosynthesis